jgi:hypothetical protein
VVKCEAAKTVAKSRSRRGEAMSYWKNENVVGPNTWYNEQVKLKGGTNLWHARPKEKVVCLAKLHSEGALRWTVQALQPRH